MHWKSLTIAMVALIATVAVVAIIATQDASAITPKHAQDNAIAVIAPAPSRDQDIDTVTAEIAVSSSRAGVISQREPAQVAEGNEVALAVNHVYLWDIDTVIAGKMLGSGSFNG